MGKFQSKHEFFFINPALNQALKDELWKTKSGLNLANYNMDETLSELSLCFEPKVDNPSPLRVDLPPPKLESDASKVFKIDHMRLGKKKGRENKAQNNFSIKEFECGVQLEGSESSKQEWFFTLYNFDGHGRITKEDLASLLKALYDAVGSSIKLPPHGARTLKLKLSVGQEGNTTMKNTTNLKANMDAKDKTPSKSGKEFSKMNNLTRTHVKCSNEHKAIFNQSMTLNTKPPSQQTGPKESGISGITISPSTPYNTRMSRSPPYNTTMSPSAPYNTTMSPSIPYNNTMLPSAPYNVLMSPSAPYNFIMSAASPYNTKISPSAPYNVPLDQTKKDKENKPINKYLRRNHSDGRKDSKHHKRRHRHSAAIHCPVAPACVVSAKLDSVGISTGKEKVPWEGQRSSDGPSWEDEDRRNYYLDLAGVDTQCSRLHNNLTNLPCPRPGFLASLFPGHHRSHSYDTAKCGECRRDTHCKPGITPGQAAMCRCEGSVCLCDSMGKDSSNKVKIRSKCSKLKLEHQHLRSKSSDSHEVGHRNVNSKATAGPSLDPHAQPFHHHSQHKATHHHNNRHSSYIMMGDLVGPHHRRHRHREKDQEMAMKQVAQWIEREHSWDLQGKGSLPVQRHEHHHFHEHHHHHHYHHYYET